MIDKIRLANGKYLIIDKIGDETVKISITKKNGMTHDITELGFEDIEALWKSLNNLISTW